jgi:hypothetical protein
MEYQSNMTVNKCRLVDIILKISHISLIWINIFAIAFHVLYCICVWIYHNF